MCICCLSQDFRPFSRRFLVAPNHCAFAVARQRESFARLLRRSACVCLDRHSRVRFQHTELNVSPSSAKNAVCMSRSFTMDVIDHISVSVVTFVILPRLLLPICFSLLTLPWAEAQSVTSSNATMNTSIEFVMTTTLNRMLVEIKILPLTNSAGLSDTLSQSQLEVCYPSRSLCSLL